LSGGKGGRNGLETELRRLNIVQKNSRPNHPTTCGKVERFQQTMKKWLRAQPVQPTTIAELQALLDTFVEYYNRHRPHRSLPHRCTPATAYHARPKATPTGDRTGDIHHRVRTDRVDDTGAVSLRRAGRLHHIGLGRTHARTRVLLLVQDLQITIINAATGELLRELVLDPTRTTNPADSHPDPAPKTHSPEPNAGSELCRCLETSHLRARQCCAPGRIRTCDQRIRSPTLYPAELRARGRDESLRSAGDRASGFPGMSSGERRTAGEIQGCRSIPVTLSGWFCRPVCSPTRLRA